jgi:hypothetical protein
MGALFGRGYKEVEKEQEYLDIRPEKFKDMVASVPNDVKKEFGLKASNKATFDLTLIDESAPYALADAFNTWQLYKGFPELLEKEEMLKVFNSMYAPAIQTGVPDGRVRRERGRGSPR